MVLQNLYATLTTQMESTVCESDGACATFPYKSYTDDQIRNANMTCYKGGETIVQNHQMCNVTSPSSLLNEYQHALTVPVLSDKKILDTLKGPLPQVTFSCDIESDTCLFQFWIGGKESFYCGLDTCKISTDHTLAKNVLSYECENLKCQCIQDRMLCGEAGSVGMCRLERTTVSFIQTL